MFELQFLCIVIVVSIAFTKYAYEIGNEQVLVPNILGAGFLLVLHDSLFSRHALPGSILYKKGGRCNGRAHLGKSLLTKLFHYVLPHVH